MIASGANHPLAVVVTIGLAMASSPFGVLAIVVMLGTSRPLANGWSFLAGWALSITAVGLLTAWLIHRGGSSGSGSSGGSVAVQLAIGLAALLAAIVSWRRRRDPRHSGAPRWMGRVERVSPFLAFGLGLFLPTWGLIAPAVDQILGAGASTAAVVGVFVVFVVTASLGLLVPLLLYTFRRTWAETMLGAWRTWLEANAGAVIAVVLAILGGLFLVRGLVAL